MSVSAVPHVTATGFRLAIQEALAEAFPGIKMRSGRVDGPARQQSLVCVWPMRREPESTHALEENITYGVRYWARWQDPKDPDQPVDPTPLEEASETLLKALGDVQTLLGTWQISPPVITFDVERQGIEALVVGRQYNPFGMCEEVI